MQSAMFFRERCPGLTKRPVRYKFFLEFNMGLGWWPQWLQIKQNIGTASAAKHASVAQNCSGSSAALLHPNRQRLHEFLGRGVAPVRPQQLLLKSKKLLVFASARLSCFASAGHMCACQFGKALRFQCRISPVRPPAHALPSARPTARRPAAVPARPLTHAHMYATNHPRSAHAKIRDKPKGTSVLIVQFVTRNANVKVVLPEPNGKQRRGARALKPWKNDPSTHQRRHTL